MNYRELDKTGLEVFVFVERAAYSWVKNAKLGRLIEFFEDFRCEHGRNNRVSAYTGSKLIRRLAIRFY